MDFIELCASEAQAGVQGRDGTSAAVLGCSYERTKLYLQ